MFLDYYCFSIHDAYPVRSRDATAGSYLNQFKASNLQPHAAWPRQQHGKCPPLLISSLRCWDPSLKRLHLTDPLLLHRDECRGGFPVGNGRCLPPTYWFSEQPVIRSSLRILILRSTHHIPHAPLGVFKGREGSGVRDRAPT